MSARDPRELPGAVPWPDDVARRYRAIGAWQGETLASFWERCVERYADRAAVVDRGLRVTYRALHQRVLRRARIATELGLRAGDRVVVHLPNGPALLECLMALFRIGAVPVLALPGHRRLELTAFVERATARWLFSHQPAGAPNWLDTLAGMREGVERIFVASDDLSLPSGLDPLSRLLAAPSADAPVSPLLDPGALALLQLSGGSTNVPKLIARTHDDYLYSVRASAELCGLNEQTRYLAALPMTHNFSLSSPGILGVLYAGGAIVCARTVTPAEVLPLIEREQITITAAVPTLAQAWLDASPRYLEGRRLPELVLQVGGAKLDAALARRLQRELGCRLQQVFGMAEGLVNYTRLDADPELIATTQGRPLSVLDEVRIVDPRDPLSTIVPDGAVGELQTRGPYTIRGYYDNAVENLVRFTPDGFYRTGDLVRQTAEGDLIVEGRIGARILRAGEKVSPEEVERIIRSHTSVVDAAVLGVPDRALGERTVACIVVKPGAQPLTLPMLRAFLREAGLAEIKLPDRVEAIDALPTTAVGKLDRRALLARITEAQPLPQP